jgi:mRNA interferase MazF
VLKETKIIAYNTVHTGPKIHDGGDHVGLSNCEYQLYVFIIFELGWYECILAYIEIDFSLSFLYRNFNCVLYDFGMKDFDTWNIKKKKLDSTEFTNIKFKEGEIWWCSAGLNIGHEIDGKHDTFERPFYVFQKCNKKMFIGIPCTTSSKKGLFVYFLKIMNWEFVLNFSQIKSISSKRLLRKMTKVSDSEKKSIAERFIAYINRKSTL